MVPENSALQSCSLRSVKTWIRPLNRKSHVPHLIISMEEICPVPARIPLQSREPAMQSQENVANNCAPAVTSVCFLDKIEFIVSVCLCPIESPM
jgi:hypothetical protein